MKKLLLLLFAPLSLFAQFEDDYYILTNDIESSNWTSELYEYNLETNSITNTFDEIIYDDGNGNLYPQANSRLLSYIPNSPHLLVESVEHFFRPSGGENGFESTVASYNDFDLSGQHLGYLGGGGEYGGTHNIGMVGINSEDIKAITLQHESALNVQNSVKLVSFYESNFEEINLSNYFYSTTNNWGTVFYHPNPGLAYNPNSHTIYFIGHGANELPTFYEVNLSNNQITELPTDFGDAPCCKYFAMHYMRDQNKILMVDHTSSDFYTYDLNSHLVELYAETDLQFVTGIVNKHDFLGNVEVYNQGEIKIYPNPVKESLNIETNSQIEKIELFNIIGQKLKEFNSNAKKLNFSNESKGVYILKIQMKNGKIETKKIIKN